MDRSAGAAARLPESDRKTLAIQALAGGNVVTDLADQHGVSRKFVYAQTRKARVALDEAFLTSSSHLSGCEFCRPLNSLYYMI